MSSSNSTALASEARAAPAPSAAGEGAAPQPGLSRLEHWAFRVDSPFRPVAEIQALTEATSGPAQPGEALGKAFGDPFAESFAGSPGVFGEDLAQAEEEYEAFDEAEAGEAEDWDEAAVEEAEMLEETPASEHPLAAVFTLPRMAFDALSKGAWQTAIAVAIGAGHRDLNTLTNMVFWFRHPQLISQKIRADQRDLAREWLEIRDQIVKPALAGAGPSAAPNPTPSAPSTPSSAPSMPAPATAGVRTSIPSDVLRWYGPDDQDTPELRAFMRRVYDLHVKRSSKDDFVDTLPRKAIEEIWPKSGLWARKDAAKKAREMFDAARTAIADAGKTGEIRIGIRSAYRSADEQLDIWQGQSKKGKGGFPYYYKKTKPERSKAKYGGEHSEKAAAYLAWYLAQCVAAPGYSNHQDGLALDLSTRKGKGNLVKVYKGSWFHDWLVANAKKRFNFHPLASEDWHWTYRPPRGGSSSEAWGESETWPALTFEGQVATTPAIRAGRHEVPRTPVLASHRGKAPDIILRWNDMWAMPAEIDVAVHLHGYSFAWMTLPKHMEVWSGLDLGPVDGASGAGHTKPILTVLPRGHYTGVQAGRLYRYTFPALTTRDGLTKLITASLEAFAGQVGGTAPKVGRLIITAHSGGGSPLMQILRHHDPKEVHVFDGLYQDATPLAEWARRHLNADRAAAQAGGAATGAMRVFFRPGTRRFSLRLLHAISTDLAAAPGSVQDLYRVEASTLGHWQIARQYGWRILANAGVDVPDAKRPVLKGSAATRPAAARLFGAEEELEAARGKVDCGSGPRSTAEVSEDYELEDNEADGEAEFEDTEYEDPEASGEALFNDGEFEDSGPGLELETDGEAEAEDLEGLEAEFEDPEAEFEDPEADYEAEAELEDFEDLEAARMPGPVASQASEAESREAVRSAVALLDLAPDQEHPTLTALRQLMSFQFGPDLQQGSTGAAVTALQKALTRLGHAVPANGTFGADTANAVRAFQRAVKLCPSGIVRAQTKVAIIRAMTRLTNPQFDLLPEAIVRVARNQLQRWQVNGTFIRETDKAASPILIEYYRDGLCPRRPPVEKQVQDDVWHCKNPWSAAFVSWVMRSAGAGRDFPYSEAHVEYVRAARRNRCNNVTANPFWAYRATEVAPELGDLVCRSRHKKVADVTTYENVTQGDTRPLHCDIVTAGPRNGLIMVTGGNVAVPIPGASEIHGQTVAERKLRVDANGMLDLTGNQRYIFAVVRCRGAAAGVPQAC